MQTKYEVDRVRLGKGGEGRGIKRYKALAKCGPMAEDSAAKLKRGHATKYDKLLKGCTLSLPRAEICSGWADNFRQ